MSSSFIHTITAVFLFIILVFLSVSGFLTFVLDAGRKVVEIFSFPVTEVLLRLRNFFGLVFSLQKISDENLFLTKQVEELSLQVANLSAAGRENEELRAALDLVKNSQLELLSSEVIALDPLRVDQKVVLNRGSNDGVSEGAAVVTSSNTLVGVISEVFKASSQMEVITSSDVVINVETASRGTTGVVQGEHGLGLLLDLVSQSDTIEVGDRVVTSGLGGQFPKGLAIGDIVELRSGESELFQRATVLPAADLRDSRILFIVK